MKKCIIHLNLTMSSLASFLFTVTGLVFLSVSGSWKLKHQRKKVVRGLEQKKRTNQWASKENTASENERLALTLFIFHASFCLNYFVCWSMQDTAWPNTKNLRGYGAWNFALTKLWSVCPNWSYSVRALNFSSLSFLCFDEFFRVPGLLSFLIISANS